MLDRIYRIDPASRTPDEAWPVDEEFAQDFEFARREGADTASRSSVCFVGMARDIAGVLPFNLARLERLGSMFAEWSAVIVENDSTDGTKQILERWSKGQTAADNSTKPPRKIVADCRDLGRERLSGFEPLRVERYAEYRTRYRDIARSIAPHVSYVIAVDLDPWGGWSLDGVMNGIGWMTRRPRVAGMASVSLYEQPAVGVGPNGEDGVLLLHYDQWAWRGAGWKPRWEKHFPFWLPPVGSDPVACNSAFGALCIYRAQPFFVCDPKSHDGDIEHVGLHWEMAIRGWDFCLNPSQRTLMNWVPSESDVVSSAG